jgi:molybdopterin synthase catalytic subunit
MRIAVVTRPLDPAALLAEVARSANGAAVLFVGTVRDVNDGRAVTGIDYSAYDAMARTELAAVVREAGARFGVEDLVVEHRLGTLGLGEASVVIAAAHPHRAAAFDAARFVIEELKRRVPIWKREHYVDGTREWVNPTGLSGPGARDSESDARVETRAAARGAARGGPPPNAESSGPYAGDSHRSAAPGIESRVPSAESRVPASEPR